MACMAGVNLDVGITRKNAELRSLARKMHSKPSTAILEQIKSLKEDIEENKRLSSDHKQRCDECVSGENYGKHRHN